MGFALCLRVCVDISVWYAHVNHDSVTLHIRGRKLNFFFFFCSVWPVTVSWLHQDWLVMCEIPASRPRRAERSSKCLLVTSQSVCWCRQSSNPQDVFFIFLWCVFPLIYFANIFSAKQTHLRQFQSSLTFPVYFKSTLQTVTAAVNVSHPFHMYCFKLFSISFSK